jgi:hypothetical protein
MNTRKGSLGKGKDGDPSRRVSGVGTAGRRMARPDPTAATPTASHKPAFRADHDRRAAAERERVAQAVGCSKLFGTVAEQLRTILRLAFLRSIVI